jgi:pyridoxine kinase
MRERVVPAADLVTPNHFELDFLAGTESHTLEELLAAAHVVRRTGPDTVLVTSVITDDTPDDALDMVVVGADGAWRTRFPRLPHNPQGAGDLTAAVFLANVLDGHDLPTVLARTTSSVFGVVEATNDSGEREMHLVQAQDRLADPRLEFEPAQVG